MSLLFKNAISLSDCKNYYNQKYNTICSIINVASVNCAKIKQITLGLLISSLTLIFSVLLTTQIITCDICIKWNFIKKVFIIFLICLIVLTFAFLILNFIYFKRQAVYRELKNKLAIDIASSRLGPSLYVRNRYYDLIKNQTQKRILKQRKMIGKLLKETVIYWIFIGFFCAAIALIQCFMGV